MATTHTHYAFNPAQPSGSRLRGGLDGLEQSRARLIQELATMTADLEGDGSDVAHFTNVTTRYGFGSNDYSKAAWEEFSSAVAKISGDGSVSNTDAALRQLFTRLR